MLNGEFFGRGEVAKGYRNFPISDDDGVRNAFDDCTLCVSVEFWPSGVKIVRFGDDLVAGQVLDFEEIDHCLEPRYLVLKLPLALFQRLIKPCEALRAQSLIRVESVHPVDLSLRLLPLLAKHLQQFFLFGNCLVDMLQLFEEFR